MPVEITPARLKRAVLALAKVSGERRFVAVGRGTLSVTAPVALRSLSVSDDIDLFSRDDELAGLDESREQLGEGSRFHERNGFYVERVGKWTLFTQPAGWEDRATARKFGDIEVLVIGTLDLAYNKLEANREKDRQFFLEAIQGGLFSVEELKGFINEHAPNKERRVFINMALESIVKERSRLASILAVDLAIEPPHAADAARKSPLRNKKRP